MTSSFVASSVLYSELSGYFLLCSLCFIVSSFFFFCHHREAMSNRYGTEKESGTLAGKDSVRVSFFRRPAAMGFARSSLALLVLSLSVLPVISLSNMSKTARLVGKLEPSKTCLLLCDMQERFQSLIWKMDTVVSTARYMTSVSKALEIPVVATQQYTKVFGNTLPECFATPEELKATPIFEKKKFSMLTDEVQAKLVELNKDTYIICGIEAHVCVQQTCLDLLEQGKDVHVIVDGVSSQQPIDRSVALQRLQQTIRSRPTGPSQYDIFRFN